MNDLLERSYLHCKQVAKTQARNFYYSFAVLPPEKRAAMCAIYAFMRYSDDISDDEAEEALGTTLVQRDSSMSDWRAALDRAFDGDYGSNLILPAFHDTVRRHAIPKKFFHELIDGTEMDLTQTRYETFADLYRYCYHVASVVGFVCIHVWGLVGEQASGTSSLHGFEAAYGPAEACGIAFQLTNILRDVREDAERGRIYLPKEDLDRFGVSEESLLAGHPVGDFDGLMRFEAARARDYYEKALPLIAMIDPVSRPTFVIMYRIYRGLLARMEETGFRVFDGRASLSTAKKVGIVAQAWLGSRLPGGGRLLRV
jgi:phytoene synthase